MSELSAVGEPSALQLRFSELQDYLNARVVGQSGLVNRLLLSLLSDGHLLVEGVPGLAKTTAVKALASAVDVAFHRVQFTPDLLPADLTGTDVYRPHDGTFSFQAGPLFHNIVLADEVNRAPAKVQSALLEAMEERQITVGQSTHVLPALFVVMATQNPIEHDGTYSLPEAQLDRFLFKVDVGYPAAAREREILALARARLRPASAAQVSPGAPSDGVVSTPGQLSDAMVFAARLEVAAVHMAESVEQYLLALVLDTRAPADVQLQRWLMLGASPRATLGLDRAAKAHAWLDGRDYVIPEDVAAVAPDVLCHRLILTFEARSEGISGRDAVDRLLQCVPAP